MALVLAALMLGSTAFYMIYMLVLSASAASTTSQPLDDLYIRVGLMYGDGVTVGFETTTVNGYTVGIQPLQDDEFHYIPFWTIPDCTVTVAADANLSKKDMTYSMASGASDTAVGGYHIEFQTDFSVADMAQAELLRQSLDSVLASVGLYSFPAYWNGVIRLRVGAFSSRESAEQLYPFVAGIMSNFASAVIGPSATGVTLLNPSNDRILLEYDSTDGTSLGLAARDTEAESSYIKSPADNVYDGVFAYTRYSEEGVDGVAVTNVLTLDEYVEGVLPYEISSTWPTETLKAFSIAARSYAAYTLRRHDTAYHFDLCNGGHCQLYRGAGRVDENVISAVESTHGLIITYDGEIASTYYSSSCGGNTVSIGDVWGGASSPYLVAHETPWERYTEYTNGFWTVEVSPTELLTYLREQKGFTQLKGYIADLSVLEYAPNSTYVKKLRITDAYGNSVEICNTDKVRSTFGAYLKSANFVVGQGSVPYTVDTVQIVGEKIIDAATQKHVSPPTNAVSANVQGSGAMTVFVLAANASLDIPLSDTTILTGEGELSGSGIPLYVLSGDAEHASYIGNSAEAGSDTAEPIRLPRTVKEYSVLTENKTAYASSASNFIFVGKGWGHGAGMSQYGAKDLADLGYDYEHIINAYFTDIEIVHYSMVEKLGR